MPHVAANSPLSTILRKPKAVSQLLAQSEHDCVLASLIYMVKTWIFPCSAFLLFARFSREYGHPHPQTRLALPESCILLAVSRSRFALRQPNRVYHGTQRVARH